MAPASADTDSEQVRLRRFVVLAAAVLAGVAGFVNSVFLTSLMSPVSHVTGSLSQSSTEIPAGDLSSLGGLAAILCAFFVGAVGAGLMLGAKSWATGRRYGWALLAEAALLAAAPLVGTEQSLLVAMMLAAAACGLQNGMFSNYRGMVLRTSHMTGTLTDLGVLLGRHVGARDGQVWRGMLLAATLVTFVVGGLAGAYTATAAGIHALWLVALVCAALGLGYALYRHRHRQHRTHQHHTARPESALASDRP